MANAWPPVRLGEVLKRSGERTVPEPDREYSEITVRLWGKGVVERGRVLGGAVSSARFVARAGQFITSRIDARNGAMGIVPPSLEGALVTNDFPLFNVDPERIEPRFFEWLSRTPGFVDLCQRASEGTTNRVRLDESRFVSLEITLPPLPEQRRIVARIEELAAQINEARSLRRRAFQETQAVIKSRLRHLAAEIQVLGRMGDVLSSKPRNGWSARCDNADNGIPVLSLGAVTGFQYRCTEFKRTSLDASRNGHFWLKQGDLLITRSNNPELVGHAAIYDGTPKPCIYPDLMMRLEMNPARAEPRSFGTGCNRRQHENSFKRKQKEQAQQ